jgi:Zn-finger nucleic acid-binding protein
LDVFPGGSVRCACGVENVVPREAGASKTSEGTAYRDAAPRSSEAGTLTCPFCGGPCSPDARACPHCDVQLASVRCSHCYALHFFGARFCARCGKELELEPLLDATDAPCPRCGKALSIVAGGAPADFDGTAMIHECVACGGVFLDHHSLDQILSRSQALPPFHAAHAAPKSRHVLDPVRYVKCPLCHGVMNRINFGKRSGVIVDVCGAHGTFFDAGELTQAIEFAAKGGLAETARREEEHASKKATDPVVARAAAEMQMELVRDAVHEGREVGFWQGRSMSSWGQRRTTLLDVLLDLLRL